jgi:putative hydrolase of the HAD superfamily
MASPLADVGASGTSPASRVLSAFSAESVPPSEVQRLTELQTEMCASLLVHSIPFHSTVSLALTHAHRHNSLRTANEELAIFNQFSAERHAARAGRFTKHVSTIKGVHGDLLDVFRRVRALRSSLLEQHPELAVELSRLERAREEELEAERGASPSDQPMRREATRDGMDGAPAPVSRSSVTHGDGGSGGSSACAAAGTVHEGGTADAGATSGPDAAAVDRGAGDGNAGEAAPPVTTLVFDIDDTLYDVGTGFTAHRNSDSVYQFMIEKLGFADATSAAALRNEYFAKYHSTVKALTVAEAEGRLPAGAHFETAALASWWAETLDFTAFLTPNPALIDSLRRCPLKLVAFTNAPRKYAVRVLEALGLRELFPDEMLFAVDDVMPACKPEPAAFAKVLSAVGSTAAESIMVEDSMKNIRAAKAIGMRTVLVRGLGSNADAAAAGEATKAGDAPEASDPAVDVVINECSGMEASMPQLWVSGPAATS